MINYKTSWSHLFLKTLSCLIVLTLGLSFYKIKVLLNFDQKIIYIYSVTKISLLRVLSTRRSSGRVCKLHYSRCLRKWKCWKPLPSHYNLFPDFFFLLTWSVKWSNIAYKMISPKIKLLWGEMNTPKFARTNRVYSRVGQPEYIFLIQKIINEVRVGLALNESNVDDIRPYWWRQFWSQFCCQKAVVCWQSQRLTAKKRIFMFPAVHRVLIKVNKYLVDKCKSFS